MHVACKFHCRVSEELHAKEIGYSVIFFVKREGAFVLNFVIIATKIHVVRWGNYEYAHQSTIIYFNFFTIYLTCIRNFRVNGVFYLLFIVVEEETGAPFWGVHCLERYREISISLCGTGGRRFFSRVFCRCRGRNRSGSVGECRGATSLFAGWKTIN